MEGLFFSVIILILVVIPAGLLFYNFSRTKKLKEVYPFQKKLILQLIDELSTSSFYIYQNTNSEITFQEFKLLSTEKKINKRFSAEVYEDYKITFSCKEFKIIDIEFFTNNPLFPKEIRVELLHFHNTSYEKIKVTPSYFLFSNSDSELQFSETYEGNAEGFESWSGFNECRTNLNYVILQWLRDNATANDFELTSKLNLLGNRYVAL